MVSLHTTRSNYHHRLILWLCTRFHKDDLCRSHQLLFTRKQFESIKLLFSVTEKLTRSILMRSDFMSAFRGEGLSVLCLPKTDWGLYILLIFSPTVCVPTSAHGKADRTQQWRKMTDSGVRHTWARALALLLNYLMLAK